MAAMTKRIGIVSPLFMAVVESRKREPVGHELPANPALVRCCGGVKEGGPW